MLKPGEKGSILQRDKQTYAVVPHTPCGVVTPDELRRIADVAEKYGCSAVKLTSAARIALIGVREEDMDRVWEELGMKPGQAVGLCIRSIKACPGATFCRLGQQDSLAMGLRLDERYHGMPVPGKMKLGVSGCMNQCAENCIKDVSLVGKKSGWTLMVGGSGSGKPRLAEVLAEDLTEEHALALMEKIVAFYRKNAKAHERIGKMMDRMGMENFRKAIFE